MEYLWLFNIGCFVVSFLLIFVCLKRENYIGMWANIFAAAINAMIVASHLVSI